MAIVRMRKLNLIAMSYDKDAVLDALQRTNAAEVTLHADTENTVIPSFDTEEDRAYYASVESALQNLCIAVERQQKEHGEKSDFLKDGFDVSYSEFLAAKEGKAEADALVERVNALTDEKNNLKAEGAKLAKQKEEASVYSALRTPFSAFADTAHTRVRLGVIPSTAKDALEEALSKNELCAWQILNTEGESTLVCVAVHKSVAAEADTILSAYGFAECPYEGAQTGAEIFASLTEKETSINRAISENEAGMYALKSEIRGLKIYCDYLGFALEKANVTDKLRETERTFLLEAYVPEPSEKEVEEELRGCTSAMYMEFSDPSDTDEPPTLLKNNAITSCFEGITNTYSAPNYREFDPNGIMAFFYSVFMGFIIGDAGYGLTMLLGGGFLWLRGRKRPTGTSKLAGAFAIGGIFAIIWGLLFNSFFGFAILPKALLPNPQTDMWSLAGIKVPSVLIISMLIGVVQIAVGYFCRAVQEWRRGHVIDGICDGVIWTVFSVGVGLAVIGFTTFFRMPVLRIVGGVTAGVSLLLAMLTAGRKEKFFGKFTKGFGAAYGVINFASDILSYARLYGLMLSGAVIAGIIADYSGQFIMSGNVLLIALAVVLLLIGNGFNLVMNLLGAYIHDARLQYVEFYGRFFEGEGELFKPLGSEHKYIYLLPAREKKEEQKLKTA